MREMNSTDNINIHATSEFCGLETDCVNDSATRPPPPRIPPPQWGLLTLSVIPVWIVAGNSLVLLALLLQRHLQNMSNRVIASLAVTDFLLALLVVPLSVYQLVRALRSVAADNSHPTFLPRHYCCRCHRVQITVQSDL